MNCTPAEKSALSRLVLLILVALCGLGTGSTHADSNIGTLNIAHWGNLAPDVSTRDTEVAVELWGKQLGVDWDMEIVPTLTILEYDNTQSLLKALQSGAIDLLSMDSVSFLRLRESTPIEPAFVSRVGEDIEEQYILLSRSDVGQVGIADLKKGTLIVEKGRASTAARIWLETEVMKAGSRGLADHFGKVVETSKSSQAVLPVMFGQSDFCFIRKRAFLTMNELNPQVSEKLTTIITSPKLLAVVTCFASTCSEKKKALIIEGASRLHEHQRGRQILTLFGLSQVLPFAPQQIATVEALIDEFENLKQYRGIAEAQR